MEEEVFIARYGLGQPRNGLMRRRILEAIQEHGKRGLVYGFPWVIRADIFFFLEVLKQLSRADLISVRIKYAVHWCSRRWRNG